MQKKCFYDTRAVLEGRQTMFRMEVKCPSNAFGFRVMRNGVGDWFVETYDDDERPIGYIEPRYRVGEIVSIAQAYKDVPPYRGHPECSNHRDLAAGWTNKSLVRAEAMPHHIKITDIKVERLQDISGEDILREGVLQSADGYDCYTFDGWVKHTKGKDLPTQIYTKNRREAFAALIDKTRGKGTWKKNPYVFAYSFERVD